MFLGSEKCRNENQMTCDGGVWSSTVVMKVSGFAKMRE